MRHTPNGPSSLSKRERCPASMTVEASLERTKFDKRADSGSRCHKAMECHVMGAPLPDMSDEEYGLVQIAIDALDRILCGDKIVPGKMETVGGGRIMIEIGLNGLPYSVDGSPEYGTCDLAIVYMDHILLIDWKFGGAFVDHPKWNRQTQAYALGLWELFPGRDIHVAIVKPRAGIEHVVEPWIYECQMYQTFKSELTKIVTDCHENQETYCVGQACQFCLGAMLNACPARLAALNMFSTLQELRYEELPEERRSQLLTAARAARASADKLIDEARALIKSTGEVPEGYRASRTSKDNVRIDACPSCPSWPFDWQKRPKDDLTELF